MKQLGDAFKVFLVLTLIGTIIALCVLLSVCYQINWSV